MKSPVEDFLATVLLKLCPQMELKTVKQEKIKIRMFCCEGHFAMECQNVEIFFLEITITEAPVTILVGPRDRLLGHRSHPLFRTLKMFKSQPA